jgi:hypothetical protein
MPNNITREMHDKYGLADSLSEIHRQKREELEAKRREMCDPKNAYYVPFSGYFDDIGLDLTPSTLPPTITFNGEDEEGNRVIRGTQRIVPRNAHS